MSFSKRWMIAAAAAGLLVSGSSRAGDGYDSAHRADAATDNVKSDVRAVPANEGGGSGEIVLPSQSDERASTKTRSAKGTSRSDADRAFPSDAEEMAAGNTRGRG